MFASNSSQVSSDAVFIEDTFSCTLYTGNDTGQTITNGIDLSGKGGLVWIKGRANPGTSSHSLIDTVRGRSKMLASNTTAAQVTSSATGDLTSFNSNGFTLGVDENNYVNRLSETYASWTFRKQAKFFDVVTYTGDGTAGRTVAHNLGSVPGCIMVKRTDDAASWNVYHVSLGNTQYIELNGTSAAATSTSRWNNTTPTSTVFTLGTSANVNASGATYVAYLFAHDAGGFGLTGTDNVISCGSYTGDGTTNYSKTISLGYEPQWIMVKRSSTTGSWFMLDTMRGWNMSDLDMYLAANLSNAETDTSMAQPNATGFAVGGTTNLNASGATYIYIAIRRGPMKTPTSGTSVFTPVQQTSQSSVTTNFPVDAIWSTQPSNGGSRYSVDRLRGGTQYLYLNDTAVEGTIDPAYAFSLDNNTGFNPNLFYPASRTIIYWNMRRAPSFFDVVCYTGTGSATTFNHNLGVVPELMIVKRRGTTNAWAVYANNDNTDYLVLNTTAAMADDNTYWNDTSPTSTVFSVGTNNAVNASGSTYVAYLFATCAGVSKVGSYTGTGTTKQIDCGFTGGARFVMIKRTDDTGDWYVWDSARGIVSGNDPYLILNDTVAQVTNTDYIDTYSAGFEISSTAPAAINANGGSFIFFAVA